LDEFRSNGEAAAGDYCGEITCSAAPVGYSARAQRNFFVIWYLVTYCINLYRSKARRATASRGSFRPRPCKVTDGISFEGFTPCKISIISFKGMCLFVKLFCSILWKIADRSIIETGGKG